MKDYALHHVRHNGQLIAPGAEVCGLSESERARLRQLKAIRTVQGAEVPDDIDENTPQQAVPVVTPVGGIETPEDATEPETAPDESEMDEAEHIAFELDGMASIVDAPGTQKPRGKGAKRSGT